jgi:hypothetical protein
MVVGKKSTMSFCHDSHFTKLLHTILQQIQQSSQHEKQGLTASYVKVPERETIPMRPGL